mgnify:CR=1 FL=1
MPINRATESLLPGAPNAESQRQPKGEHALDLAISRLAHVPIELPALWDATECPEHLLPWLAWALSVDSWDPEATDAEKRALIQSNQERHKKKGTAGAVLSALSEAGYAGATIIEGIGQVRRNGSYRRTGLLLRNSSHWALYSIKLTIDHPPMTNETLDLIGRVAPERCKIFKVFSPEV